MDRQSENQSGQLRLTRVPVNIPAEYEFKKNKGECVIVDFSEGGIAIEVNQIFIEGDLIHIRAQPTTKLELDIWCVVRNILGRKVGLEFEEISNRMRQDLENYVYNLLSENDKKRYESY